jgi:Flp pilus assembly pilin Flp
MDHLGRLLQEERGQTMPEYAVVLGVITLAVVATLTLLSTSISHLISAVVPLV